MPKSYNVQKLHVKVRPEAIYTYYVTGLGKFPLDMLRYDKAWPACCEDSNRMGWEDGKARSVQLYSYQPPEIDRWASFNWAVTDTKMVNR